jgi:hypothetical protein
MLGSVGQLYTVVKSPGDDRWQGQAMVVVQEGGQRAVLSILTTDALQINSVLSYRSYTLVSNSSSAMRKWTNKFPCSSLSFA